MGLANGAHQLAVARPLRHVACRPGIQCGQRVVLVLGRGEHQDAGPGMQRPQFFEDGHAIEAGQRQVEQHQVGTVPTPEREQFLAPGRAGHDFQVSLPGERLGQPLQKDRVVVYQHQPDRGRRRASNKRRIGRGSRRHGPHYSPRLPAAKLSLATCSRGRMLGPGQAAEIGRVCKAYPHLNDANFVARHRADWLRP